MSTGKRARRTATLILAVALLALAGCRQDMQDQPYYEPFEKSDLFENGSTNQPIPAGTVARGLYKDGEPHYWFGRVDSGALVADLPGQVQWSAATLERGRQRYEIYCSVCHDSSGSGRGMIVQRGFKQPQPLYEDRLRAKPIGYFYDVITNGFGIMPSYAIQVPVDDRWAIAAYVRVLQRSQGVPLDQLSPELQDEFRLALAEAEHGGDTGGGHGAEGDQGDDHGGGH
ncbi:MAG: cytochrome c [Holophagales bacterium]|nr:cytochrome c [Holophagales bacterium]